MCDDAQHSQTGNTLNSYYNKPTTADLAGRLRFARERLGFNQHQLAQRSGVGRAVIGNLETDRSTMTRDPEKVVALASALKVTPQWLLWGHNPERPLTGEALNLAIAFDSVPNDSAARQWCYHTMMLAARDIAYRREKGLPLRDEVLSYADLTEFIDFEAFHARVQKVQVNDD
ncbi:MAG: helix-turn-helix domain-containing protein [Gammaproteobacteria bacterium]